HGVDGKLPAGSVPRVKPTKSELFDAEPLGCADHGLELGDRSCVHRDRGRKAAREARVGRNCNARDRAKPRSTMLGDQLPHALRVRSCELSDDEFAAWIAALL